MSKKQWFTAFLMFGLLAVRPAWAGSLFSVTNGNTATSAHNTSVVARDPTHPYRQTFVDNADSISSIAVEVVGPGCTTDQVFVNLYDGCGDEFLSTASAVVDTTRAKLPQWITIPLAGGPYAMTYGAYYSMDVWTKCASLEVNYDSYQMGRGVLAVDGFVDGSFPAKKQDLMFNIAGTNKTVKVADPNPTTNVACSNPAGSFASQCIPIYPENGAGGARNYFNVLIRESHDVDWPTATDNSFWQDYTYRNAPPGTINTILIPEIKKMLDKSYGGFTDGVRQTEPFADWWGPNVNPANINFYLSVQDPRRDPEGFRGFFNCANIDLVFDLMDNPGENPDSVGWGARLSFYGFVTRPGPNSGGWGDGADHGGGGASRRTIASREPFGSIGNEIDEFACATSEPMNGQSQCPMTFPNQPLLASGYDLAVGPPGCTDPLSSSWCQSAQTVDWLKALMQQNPLDFASQCWDKNVQADCAADPACYWVAGLPEVSYFGSYNCIPQTVSMYDIGIGCANNSSCYLGVGFGVNYINMAESGDFNMQQGPKARFVLDPNLGWQEYNESVAGYGGAEPEMAQAMTCLFSPASACATYDANCSAFVAKWDGGWYGEPSSTRNPNNRVFMQAGKACTNGVSTRR